MCSLRSGVAVLHLQCAMAYVTYCAAAVVGTSAVKIFITGSHSFWPMPRGVLSLVSHHFISHLHQAGQDELTEVDRHRLLCGKDGAGYRFAVTLLSTLLYTRSTETSTTYY